MTAAPSSPSNRATVDLPQPIGPVMPMTTVTGRRSSSSSQASSAGASAASTSASSLVTRRSSTKFAATTGSPSASSRWFLRRPRRVSSASSAAFCAGRHPSTASVLDSADRAGVGRLPRRDPRWPARRSAAGLPDRGRAAAPALLPRSAATAGHRPAVRDGRPPTPDTRHRTPPPPPSPTTHSRSHTVSSSRRSWETTSSVAGDSAQEPLDRLASRDVEVVGRLVEEEQVRRLDAEQRQLEPRPLAAGQRADLLEHVVATEQEPGEVRARLAVGHRDRLVSASRTVAPGMAAPRSWARYPSWTLWPERREPSSGGSSPAIVRSSVVLPAPFGPTMPIRSPRWATRTGPRDRRRLGRRPPSTWTAPRPGGTRRRRPRAGRRSRPSATARASPLRASPRQRQLPPRFAGLAPLGEELLESGLVLVHLRELAVASIALDELALANDLLRQRVGLLSARASRSSRWRWYAE